ncbi:MAG: hypothetical protein ABS35_16740 [Kaistia sp. SCN 65-12]|nr:MAG: hypothetical protein ABS35_16740 [Kaistia sp. SCN 65-12]
MHLTYLTGISAFFYCPASWSSGGWSCDEAVVFFYSHDHDDAAAMFLNRHRLYSSQINEAPEAVLGLACRHGFHGLLPDGSHCGYFGRKWQAELQWPVDRCGYATRTENG